MPIYFNKYPLDDTQITTEFVDSNEIAEVVSDLSDVITQLYSNISNLSSQIDYLLFASDSINKIIWSQNTTYYVNEDKTIDQYETLQDALNTSKLSSFSGVIQVAEDLIFNDDPLLLHQHGLIIDLNKHKITLNRSTFANISSNNEIDPGLNQLPNITIRNGNFYQDVTNETAGNKFIIYNGTLNLENINITLNCENNTNTTNYIIRMNGSDNANYIVKSEANVDKNCTFSILNMQYENYCFSQFSSYFRIVINKKLLDKDKYFETIGNRDVAPYILFDGKLVFSTQSGSNVKGAFVASNGSDIGESYITLNENAYLNFDNTSQGIYVGAYTNVTLNGCTIIAGTPIVMRGGVLTIPENSNPTLIATGEYKPYDPLHTITGGGSDAGSKLFLGHAILLESNPTTGYGGHGISADIRSGKFLSYHNTPIGSYAIATDKLGNYTPRLTKFVKNCEFYGLPSQNEYKNNTGENPDYDILADELYNPLKSIISLEQRVKILENK